MGNYVKNKKMFVLSRIFQKNIKVKIASSNRSFVTQFNLYIPKLESFTKTEVPVIVYLLSDMVLISRLINESVEIYEAHILLDWQSFVKEIPDQKFYSNLFAICGRKR